MEDIPQEPSSPQPNHTSPPPTVSPVYFGTALAIAFAIGLFIGLMGRPLVIQDVPVQVVVTVVPNQNEEAAGQASVSQDEADNESAAHSTTNQSTNEEIPQAANDGAATPTLMEFVMADARHIQGDPNAPVTMIEYSDFK